MKHRYITCGDVKGTDKISSFRLLSNIRTYGGFLGETVRVNIPNDLQISHWNGDIYSTTSDNRTLDELGWDCYILFKGKWRKFNYLKKFLPAYWHNVLEYIFSLYNCGDTIGWTDDIEVCRKYINDGCSGRVPFKKTSEYFYPPFKECKKELELPIKIMDAADDFLKHQVNEDWYKEYAKLKELMTK